MSEQNNIVVKVQSEFLEQHVSEKEEKYAFAYHITIHNQSDDVVQLLERYWLITDADGKKVEVHGEGVVGKQPILEPDQSFQYTSGALLDTPVGTMEGYYNMRNNQGDVLKVTIPVFGLADPSLIN